MPCNAVSCDAVAVPVGSFLRSFLAAGKKPTYAAAVTVSAEMAAPLPPPGHRVGGCVGDVSTLSLLVGTRKCL